VLAALNEHNASGGASKGRDRPPPDRPSPPRHQRPASRGIYRVGDLLGQHLKRSRRLYGGMPLRQDVLADDGLRRLNIAAA